MGPDEKRDAGVAASSSEAQAGRRLASHVDDPPGPEVDAHVRPTLRLFVIARRRRRL
jgi:hypothetical protein